MNGKRILWVMALSLLLAEAGLPVFAQVPSCINYQGRLIRNGTNFNGVAQFKFKLLNADATTAYWSNDGTDGGPLEPTLAVPITVSRGLFYARVGDTNLTNMSLLPSAVFTNADLRLRIWVDSGSGSELIVPDSVMASVGYSMMSANVEDGVVTPAKLSPESHALFVPVSGGIMSGPLTNAFGFYGTGGVLSHVSLNAVSNQFSVGADQMVVVSNRVGIGTAAPESRLEIVGGDGSGEMLFRIRSGTNVVAWARKKIQ